MSDLTSNQWLCPYHGNAYKPTECVCCSLATKRNAREKQ